MQSRVAFAVAGIITRPLRRRWLSVSPPLVWTGDNIFKSVQHLACSSAEAGVHSMRLSGVEIIRREPLANFSSRVAYDSINIGVIVRRTAEDIDSDGTLISGDDHHDVES